MPEEEIRKGQRFSQVYLRREEQLEDSQRMRRRLGASVYEHGRGGFGEYLRRKLGLKYESLGGQSSWMEYFVSLELRDVLDSVTVLLEYLSDRKTNGDYHVRHHAQLHRPAFLREVRQIFLEEGVRYSVDDLGGVHLRVDEQFEVTRAATVQGMGGPRYGNALASLESGYRALDAVPADGRSAIRDVFDAAENLFKMTFEEQQLKGDFIKQKLKPRVVRLCLNQEARTANGLMCESFVKWVDAAHVYRHKNGSPDPHQPPLDLAILMVSQGTAFVRWLVTIDRAINAVATPEEC